MDTSMSNINNKNIIDTNNNSSNNKFQNITFQENEKENENIKNTNFNIKGGNYKNFENYKYLHQLLQIPLVQIYIKEIINKHSSFEKTDYPKIKGIYNTIFPLFNEFLKELNIELYIPNKYQEYEYYSYSLKTTPTNEKDLDIYIPLFFLEWLIYPKSLIKLSKLRKITFIHECILITKNYKQYRAGVPEYIYNYNLFYCTKERDFNYIQIVIHHEYFHFIDFIHDKSFDDIIWRKFNSINFNYGIGGWSERIFIKLDSNIKGFINHFSMSAIEEDKAEIYQFLMINTFNALNNKDVIIQKKVYRIIEFLKEFDKIFFVDNWENYFRNIYHYRNNVLFINNNKDIYNE